MCRRWPIFNSPVEQTVEGVTLMEARMAATEERTWQADGIPAVALVVLSGPSHLAERLEYLGHTVERFEQSAELWLRLSASARYSTVWYDPKLLKATTAREQITRRGSTATLICIAATPESTPDTDADASVHQDAPDPLIGATMDLAQALAEARQALAGAKRDESITHEGLYHDIRGPLAAVAQLGTAIGAREMLTADGRAELSGLIHAAKAAFDNTHATPPSPTCEPKPVSARALIEAAARNTGFAAEIITWEPANADPLMQIDPVHFRRVLEHQLVNARQHGGGKALIRVVCANDQLQVDVIDSGAADSKATITPGHGIRYCQAVLGSHQGTFEVTARTPAGHISRADWPGLIETRQLACPLDVVNPDRPTRVWFADDEDLVRRAINRLLRRAGFETRTFDSGDALLDAMLIVGDPPDVVICDADMPGTQGLDALQKVQEIAPRTARVLFTAYQPTPTVIDAFNRGTVHRFVRKGQLGQGIDVCVQELAAERRPVVSRQDDIARSDFENLLDKARMTLHVQPLFDAGTQRLIACEALLRSQHPSFRGPLDILDASRTYSREIALQRVLSRIAREHRARLPQDIDLFVNIDPVILRNVQHLELAFEPLFDAAGQNVVVELTERARLSSDGEWRKAVARLRNAGFRIALDDVGAGYNSLGAVVAVEPEVIKLDISLVSNIHRDSTKAQIVGLLSEYANRNGIVTVAEGIEEAAEAETCRNLGASLLQGYHLARPMPFDDLLARYCSSDAARFA